MLDSTMLEPKEREGKRRRWAWLGEAFFILCCFYFISQLPYYFGEGQIVFGIASALVWPAIIIQYGLKGLDRFTGEGFSAERLNRLLTGLMALGLVVLFFDLAVNMLPYLRSAELPYPDVRLEATATRSERLVTPSNIEQTAGGLTFVVVEATVRSVYGNQGEQLDLYPFRLRADGRTYDYATASFGLPGACDEVIVPAGGAASCKVVFEVPDTLEGGVLSYDSLTGYDKTEIRF